MATGKLCIFHVYFIHSIQLLLGYLLLGLISSLVFRAIRDALPNDMEAQERILGASFTALALADVGFSVVYIHSPNELYRYR